MLRVLTRVAHIGRRDLEAGVLTIEFERRQFPRDRLA
jgi:hypothetical protein